jgi:hypothetical protein
VCECVGFCDVWVCVCVRFVLCVSFGNMCNCTYSVLNCLYSVFCIVPLKYTFSYMFCLYCHRLTTQLQLIIIMK